MPKKQSPQALIAALMEDVGKTETLSGAAAAQNEMTLPFATDLNFVDIHKGDGQEDDYETQNEEQYSEKELKITKRFIEIVGGADRARELLDKVDECEDCLGLVDEEDDDESIIQQIADAAPEVPDFPTSIKNMGISTLYNPSQTSGIMT